MRNIAFVLVLLLVLTMIPGYTQENYSSKDKRDKDAEVICTTNESENPKKNVLQTFWDWFHNKIVEP